MFDIERARDRMFTGGSPPAYFPWEQLDFGSPTLGRAVGPFAPHRKVGTILRLYRTVLLLLLWAAATSCSEGPEQSQDPLVKSIVREQRLHLISAGPGGPRFGSRFPSRMVSTHTEQRNAVVANAGQDVVFRDVPLHPAATLRVGLGVSVEHFDALSAPVIFEVLAEAGNGERLSLERRALDPRRRDSDRGWVDIEVPLSRERLGASIDLILRAMSTDGELARLAAWSDPLIVSDGRRVTRRMDPPCRSTTVRDLLEEAQNAPPSAAGIRPLRLSATQQAGPEPALAIEPGEAASWSLEPTDSPATLHFEIFAHPLSRKADGELESRVEVRSSDGSETVAVEIPLLEEPLLRKEIGIRSFSETLSLPPSDRSRTLEVAVRGDVEEGRAIVGLSRLCVTSEQPLPLRQGGGPNVILLLVDTLRADHLGTYGYQRSTSPHLDALAAEGLVFERAVSQSSWTLPATASLLTGLYPQTHGCLDFDAIRLRRELATLPEELQDAGYATAGFSANFLISRKNGFDQGFSHFEDLFLLPARDLNSSFLAWLDSAGDRPFFGYLHYYDPHYPYSAPPPFDTFFGDANESDTDRERWLEAMRRFASLEESVLLTQLPWRVQPELENDLQVKDGAIVVSEWLRQRWIDRYDGEIRYWDTALGELLAALEERELRDDTWIIVTSDHGEAFGEHEWVGHAGNLYEELIRVPLILSPPAGGESERAGEIAGQRFAAPVELRDLARTVLGLLAIDTDLPGQALLPIDTPLQRLGAFSFLRRGSGERDEEVALELAAMNLAEWKAIETIDTGSYELFHMDRDPGESSNLSESEDVPVDRLRSALEGWVRRTPRADPDAIAPASESTREQLRALGYVGR